MSCVSPGLTGETQNGVAGRIAQDLDVAAVSLVLAAVPRLGAGRAVWPVRLSGRDEGAVQAHVRPVLLSRRGQDVVQLRGTSGDDVDALVQVPVGGRGQDTGVAGQDGDPGGIHEPAHHQVRMRPGDGGPLPAALVDTGTVGCDPPRHGA